MIYVYRRAASDGARELVEDILMQGARAKRTQGKLLTRGEGRPGLVAGDFVVCWGNELPVEAPRGVSVLNNVAPISKYNEARKLAEAGVPTVQVSLQRPVARAVAPRAEFQPGRLNINGGPIDYMTAAELKQRIDAFLREQDRARELHNNAVLAAAAAPREEWLPRRNNHVGGSDLLNAPAAPDYYSKKENIVEEYRVHMFKGKSIRAGVKRQRNERPNGQAPHPWIRSFDAGWIIAYQDFRSTAPMRDIAKRAVEALGLDFGAVDIGKKADGTLIVLEVNRAPGVEGGTSEAYARKIVAWSKGEVE
jgi:hypothetical protein